MIQDGTQMNKSTSISSLASSLKNPTVFAISLEQSKEPLVLTVNGKAKLVIQDAEAYQEMLDELEKSRFIDAVRQGLKEADQGLGRPAEVVFVEMKAKYGL